MNSKDPSFYRKKRSGSRNQNEPNIQLVRLLLAIGLFLTVLVGKQIYPQKLIPAGEKIVKMVGANTDLDAVFARLGSSLVYAEDRLSGLEEFCVAVFGEQKEDDAGQSEIISEFRPVLPGNYTGLLSREMENLQVLSSPGPSVSEMDPQPILAVGSVEIKSEMEDGSFPEGHTADKLSLGTLETVTPVLGQLTSGFGFRDHPVSGKYNFHSGADIGAGSGEPIFAFADGVVEYVGEDNSYGLYFQLDHGNGVKSFYAHCLSVCVQTGQSIRKGEMVAEVGDTGVTTGPHLHFEVKCCDLRVDPAYYIEFL